MKNTINVGLIGFGTVGGGLAQVLLQSRSLIENKVGVPISLKTVADLRVAELPEAFAGVTLTRDAAEIFADPAIDIVVELIGGMEPARTFMLRAIEAKKHVVTANKALLSVHGAEIFAAAARMKVSVGFEASVGGGIPVIKALKEGLAANTIRSIMGIMNGTANYILSRMDEEHAPFADVLKDAQAQGLAEADPSYDVDGIDTAHKLAILATMAYGKEVKLDDITVEGISMIEPLDLQFARELGCRIKLLAISKNHGDHVEVRVHPTLVPESHLLASINGAYNAIHFNGDAVGNVLLYGLGAGMMPTGSAVAADVMDIARDIVAHAVNRIPSLGFHYDTLQPCAITPMDDLACPFYFRLSVKDEPGVLAAVAAILGRQGISIESVIQKGRGHAAAVPLVICTHTATEQSVRCSLEEIDKLDVCVRPTVKLRIMSENDG